MKEKEQEGSAGRDGWVLERRTLDQESRRRKDQLHQLFRTDRAQEEDDDANDEEEDEEENEDKE